MEVIGRKLEGTLGKKDRGTETCFQIRCQFMVRIPTWGRMQSCPMTSATLDISPFLLPRRSPLLPSSGLQPPSPAGSPSHRYTYLHVPAFGNNLYLREVIYVRVTSQSMYENKNRKWSQAWGHPQPCSSHSLPVAVPR